MSSFTLKIIALTAMIIDHLGFSIEYRYFLDIDTANLIESAMRAIGRLAMPIYIFLIAQGCTKTKNIKKYMKSLFVFALISEIPFDLFVSATVGQTRFVMPTFFDNDYQNVFFTLFLGVLAVYLFNEIRKTKWKYLSFVPVLFCCILSETFHTDYGSMVVLTIFIVYIVDNKYLKLLVVAIFIIQSRWSVPNEMWIGLTSVILLYFYNGKRGYNIKWLFYWLYPLHLAFIAMTILLFMAYLPNYL